MSGRPRRAPAAASGGARAAMQFVSIALALAAAVWTAVVVRQALQADDGGPPLGAVFMAVPAVVLLTAAGAVWPKRASPDKTIKGVE